MKGNNPQFKKGVLEMVVLDLISKEDLYGYDIIRTLEQESHGIFTLKEGSLYPLLYRLEDKGYIASYLSDYGTERKVPRKYYQITPSGKIAHRELLDDWSAFQDIVNHLIKGGKNNA